MDQSNLWTEQMDDEVSRLFIRKYRLRRDISYRKFADDLGWRHSRFGQFEREVFSLSPPREEEVLALKAYIEEDLWSVGERQELDRYIERITRNPIRLWRKEARKSAHEIAKASGLNIVRLFEWERLKIKSAPSDKEIEKTLAAYREAGMPQEIEEKALQAMMRAVQRFHEHGPPDDTPSPGSFVEVADPSSPTGMSGYMVGPTERLG